MDGYWCFGRQAVQNSAQGGWVTDPRALPSSCQLPMLSLHRAEQGLPAAVSTPEPPYITDTRYGMLQGRSCLQPLNRHSSHLEVHSSVALHLQNEAAHAAWFNSSHGTAHLRRTVSGSSRRRALPVACSALQSFANQKGVSQEATWESEERCLLKVLSEEA